MNDLGAFSGVWGNMKRFGEQKMGGRPLMAGLPKPTLDGGFPRMNVEQYMKRPYKNLNFFPSRFKFNV